MPGISMYKSPHWWNVFHGNDMIVHHLSGWCFGCHFWHVPIYWVANHPNWLSYCSERFKPPTSYHFGISGNNCALHRFIWASSRVCDFRWHCRMYANVWHRQKYADGQSQLWEHVTQQWDGDGDVMGHCCAGFHHKQNAWPRVKCVFGL